MLWDAARRGYNRNISNGESNNAANYVTLPINIIRQRRMRLMGRRTHKGNVGSAHKILTGKIDGRD
jgi:hypothetical protein